MTMLLICISGSAQAEDGFGLTADGRKFEPATLSVPAGAKFKLVIKNTGTTPVEFESEELNREKIIPPGASAVIYLGPLRAGTYSFFDDFHQAAKGHIVAK